MSSSASSGCLPLFPPDSEGSGRISGPSRPGHRSSPRTPSRSRRRFPFRSLLLAQPFRQQVPDLRAMPSQQPLLVQHTLPVLLPIPSLSLPPFRVAFFLLPVLSLPQQSQRLPLYLSVPLYLFLCPVPLLFPSHPLLEVPEHVLLAEPPRKPFHHLLAGLLCRRTDQVVPLSVTLYLVFLHLFRHFRTVDPPQSHLFLPAYLPLPSIYVAFSLLPLSLPPPPLTVCGNRRPHFWLARYPGGGRAYSLASSLYLV